VGRQHAADGAHVVVAGLFVEQVRAGQMRLVALQRQQPAQAAHVRRDQRDVRVLRVQVVAEQVEGHVVAAYGDDGAARAVERGPGGAGNWRRREARLGLGRSNEQGGVRPVDAQAGDGGVERRLRGDQRSVQIERLCGQHLGQAHIAAALSSPPGDDLTQQARGLCVEIHNAQRQQKAFQRHAVLLRVAAVLGARLQHSHGQRGDGGLAGAEGGKCRQEMPRPRADQVQAVRGVEEDAHAGVRPRGRCGDLTRKATNRGHRLRNPR